MGSLRQGVERRRWPWVCGAVLVAGALIQGILWRRSIWLYLDQVELYELGMSWARDGLLQPLGKLSSGNLPIPGVALQLLVGVPLTLWSDVRAPTLLLGAFHLLAVLVLIKVLTQDFDWYLTAIYLAVFWLSPWRLFHSSFLWETNYLVLPAALHLLACRALRERPRPMPSLWLATTLVLTFQLHGSGVILLLSCVMLLLRRQLRLNWTGFVAGTFLGSITLLPTVLGLFQGAYSSVRPEAVASLVTRFNSVEKGLIYWFRLSSLDVGRRYRQSLFCIEPGGGLVPPMPELCRVVELTEILALASVLISVVASWRFFRSRVRQASRSTEPAVAEWYREYTLSILVAVLIGAFLSPVLLQGWHLLVALPAACLPVALWIAGRWPTAGPALRGVIVLFLLWRIPASLLLLGHPMYAEPKSPELPRHVAPVELRDLVPDP